MDSCFLPMQPLFLPMQPFCFLAWTRSSYWRWCQSGGSSEQQLALHRKILTARWLHDFFLSLFSIFILLESSLDKTFIENPMFVQVLHLKSVIWYHSATLKISFFARWGGNRWRHSDDDEYFGSRPICPWQFEIQSADYNLQEYQSLPLSWIRVFMKLFVKWLSLWEIMSKLRPKPWEIVVSTNAIIMHIMFGAWIQ